METLDSLLRQSFPHNLSFRRNLTRHSNNQLTQSTPHSLSFRRNLTYHSHNQLHNPSHTVCHSAGISLVTHRINSTIHPTQFVIASPVRAKLSSPQESQSSLTQSTPQSIPHSLSFRRNLTRHSRNQLHNAFPHSLSCHHKN
jgi:hypothetical protein